MGYVIHIDGGSGGGGSGTGWNGEVQFRADLPITIGTPAIGEIYLVEEPTKFLGITTYQSGLYYRDFDTGSLSDWRRLNVATTFYNSNGTILSDRTVDGGTNGMTFFNLSYASFVTQFSTLFQSGTTATGKSLLSMTNSKYSLSYAPATGGIPTLWNLEIDVNGAIISDATNNRGLEYAQDFSANYNDRTLVDKEYVDNRGEIENTTGVFIWDSGGTQSGNVYNNFADMYAAMVLVNATEVSIQSSLIIPTGNYPQIQIIRSIGERRLVQFLPSVTLPNLGYIDTLVVISSSTFLTIDSTLQSFRSVNCQFSSISPLPYIEIIGNVANVNIFFDATDLLAGVGAIIKNSDADNTNVTTITLVNGSSCQNGTLDNSDVSSSLAIALKDGTSNVGTISGGGAVSITNIETFLDNKANPIAADSLAIVDSQNGNRSKYSTLNSLGVLENRIVVNQLNAATTLGGTIDPLKEYFLDGIITITGFSIEVPAGGINIKGYDFDISGIICADNSYTLFTSPVGGSGNFLGTDYFVEVTGTGSQVFDIVDSNGFHAIEIAKINFIDCTSLGTIDQYRQGLEFDTGRFGGSPSMTLKGNWVGGYRITTSIVRGLSAAMTEPLFKAGVGFVMNSRFLTDINVDLPILAAFCDFAPSNFVNTSTLQFSGTLISRNGTYNPEDVNITPNVTFSDVISLWRNNLGISNTHVGGKLTVSVEIDTVIAVIGTNYPILGTWDASDLQHFDSPANGQLRHIGATPREYRLSADIPMDGAANDDLSIRVRKYDAATLITSTVYTQSRQVNNFSGGRDVAFFNIAANVTLDLNDYVFLEVANNTSTTDLTAELSAFYDLIER